MVSGIYSGFKPMLSGKAPDDLATLRFPVLASPKLDGIRCLIFGGRAYSRNLKLIPNGDVQLMASHLPDGLDGELISGKPNSPDVWNCTQSVVMAAGGGMDFRFHVFDIIVADRLQEPFEARLMQAHRIVVELPTRLGERVRMVRHVRVRTPDALRAYEDAMCSRGYEGVMIRDPDGAYKPGRSTLREGGLLKLKRWFDREAMVVGAVEQQHNANEATRDELGRTKRSTAKAGKVGKDTLGALVCRFHDPVRGDVEFELGTGFDDATRASLWRDRGKLFGLHVSFKYQDLTPDGKPRFPVFIGFRDTIDLPATN